MSVRNLAHRTLRALPAPIGLWLIDTSRWLRFSFYRDLRRNNRRIHRRLGRPDGVLAGPFAGMSYIAKSSGSAFIPKIIGTYELEIAPAVETIKSTPLDVIIDIGAAEGYYAVGLARTKPDARIVCFEAHKPARYLLRRLARLNEVDQRIQMQEFCTPGGLDAALSPARRPAIICDCEGGEDVLLDPGAIPALARATILVELHEKAAPGIGDRLRNRFARTHQITQFDSRSRTPADLPAAAAAALQGEDVAQALSEYRNEPNSWYFMRPKAEEGAADDARSV